MSWQTWSPFQSEETRLLCEHLTAEERAQMVRRGGLYGLWCAFTVAIPFSFLCVAGIAYGRAVPMWAYGIAIVVIVVHHIMILPWLRSQRRLLRNSLWARARKLGTPAAE